MKYNQKTKEKGIVIEHHKQNTTPKHQISGKKTTVLTSERENNHEIFLQRKQTYNHKITSTKKSNSRETIIGFIKGLTLIIYYISILLFVYSTCTVIQ